MSRLKFSKAYEYFKNKPELASYADVLRVWKEYHFVYHFVNTI